MSDIFRRFVPGTSFQPGARQLNAMLAAARAFQRGEFHQGGPWEATPDTSTEVHVSNTTAADVVQFGVLGITTPLIDRATSANEFAQSRALVGAAPVAYGPFVVTSEPIGAGKIGRATLLGATPCQVNLTDIGHRYAVPLAGDTAKLGSQASGPARLIWTENNYAATGVVWALVDLLGDDHSIVEIGEPVTGSGSGSGSGSGAGVYALWHIVRWSVSLQTWVTGEQVYVRDANA